MCIFIVEEKTSPPGLSKKPVLPPPPTAKKKPQLSHSGSSISKTPAVSLTLTKPVETSTNGTG